MKNILLASVLGLGLIAGSLGVTSKAYACVDGAGITAACAEQGGTAVAPAAAGLAFMILTAGAITWAVYDDVVNRHNLRADNPIVDVKAAAYVPRASDVSNGLTPMFTALAEDVAGERRAEMKAEADKFAAAGYWPYNLKANTAVATTKPAEFGYREVAAQ